MTQAFYQEALMSAFGGKAEFRLQCEMSAHEQTDMGRWLGRPTAISNIPKLWQITDRAGPAVLNSNQSYKAERRTG